MVLAVVLVGALLGEHEADFVLVEGLVKLPALSLARDRVGGVATVRPRHFGAYGDGCLGGAEDILIVDFLRQDLLLWSTTHTCIDRGLTDHANPDQQCHSAQNCVSYSLHLYSPLLSVFPLALS